ncbi:MAG: MFS transporter [Oscillospiraceae bacterium]|jgi:MFS family permease
MKGKHKIHYAWVIALACLCNQAGVLGILTNCRGMFFEPICSELGFKLGELTFYATIYGIMAIIFVPIAAKLLPKGRIRLLLGSAGLLMAVSEAVQCTFSKLWQWYVVGAVQGMCSSFLLTMTISLLINNWFEKKRGLVFGMVAASSGVAGAIMNAVGAKIIAGSGWRNAYIVLGAILFVLLVPLNSLAVRFKPEDMGLLPYGAGEEPEGGVKAAPPVETGFTAREAIRTAAFWLMLIVVGFNAVNSNYNQMLGGYGKSVGYPEEQYSMFISIAMIGSIFIKLLLGHLIDRIGCARTIDIANIMSVAGFLFLLFGKVDVLVYCGLVLQGTTMALNSVVFPVWTRHLFGYRDYASIYSYVSISSNAFTSIGLTFFGTIIDSSDGSYIPSAAVGMAIMIVCLAAALYCNAWAARRRTGPEAHLSR